jgi:hypothetical protein
LTISSDWKGGKSQSVEKLKSSQRQREVDNALRSSAGVSPRSNMSMAEVKVR